LHIVFWWLEITNLYLQDANGPTSEALLRFSDLVMTLILPIAIGVFVYLVSLVLRSPRHRKLTESQFLEFLWTSLPIVALLCLAAPSLSLLYIIDEVGFPLSTSKITGHQWYWVYEAEYRLCSPSSSESYMCTYPIRLLGTRSPLVCYSQSVLRFLVTGADVLHSWALPAFALKADAVPGRLNSLSTYLDRSGVFFGQCSEICGSNHSFIPIVAEVLPTPSRGLF